MSQTGWQGSLHEYYGLVVGNTDLFDNMEDALKEIQSIRKDVIKDLHHSSNIDLIRRSYVSVKQVEITR